jgi:hypothetical protein
LLKKIVSLSIPDWQRVSGYLLPGCPTGKTTRSLIDKTNVWCKKADPIEKVTVFYYRCDGLLKMP